MRICFLLSGSGGEKVGRITVDAARETGLVAGTPVILGAQDQRCAALGAGIAPGVGTISLGTSSAVCSFSYRAGNKAGGTVTCCAVDDVVWMLESVINTSGAALKWAQKNLFTELSYQDVDMLAEQSRQVPMA